MIFKSGNFSLKADSIVFAMAMASCFVAKQRLGRKISHLGRKRPETKKE
jgi:hypothetical protein